MKETLRGYYDSAESYFKKDFTPLEKLIIGLIIFVVVQKFADSKKIQKLMYKDSKMDIWNLNYFTYWGEHKLLPEKKNNYAIVYLNFSKFRRFNKSTSI